MRHVLETVDAGGDRLPQARLRVSVREHLQTCVVGGFDDPAQHLVAELHPEHVALERQHPAARHHLDHVDASGHPLTDGGHGLGGLCDGSS